MFRKGSAVSERAIRIGEKVEENLVVELIAVGTELLLGNIVNTNAAYLAQKCAEAGLSCYYQDVVGDNALRLEQTLRTALSRADVIILCGGLGPTQDDLTKETVAKVMDAELYMDEDCLKSVLDYFERIGRTPTENNRKQALIPKGAKVLVNNNGTAPGCIIEKNGKHVIMLPGPPEELKLMYEESVDPYLLRLTPRTIFSKNVKICGVGESSVETAIEDLVNAQSNPTIATYAKTGEVHVRVSAQAEDEVMAKKLCKPIIKELKERFGNNIYSTDDDVTLEKAVTDMIKDENLSLGVVESCTGGLLAGRLVGVPGVSEVFKSGLVTYSNKAKRKLAGVRKSTLEKYGAVSSQTAEEMVKGAASLYKLDVVAATTGIAGPEGGSEEKPVGLVYVACFVCGKVTVKECHFTGSRQKIRENAVTAALDLVRRSVAEYHVGRMSPKKK